MTEQPLGGGAAFWAARGVRIEPEVADEEFGEDDGEVEAAETEVADAEVKVEETAVIIEVTEEPDDEVAEDVAEIPEVEPVAEMLEVEPVAEVPVARAAEDVEETPLPGFPQQRTSAPSPEEHQDTAEPAWQLTGGELAVPLPPLKTCIEAILMVVDEPVSVTTLAQVLERPKAEVAEALTELAEEYTVLGRGFELREVGLGSEGERTGWRVYSRPECAVVVERFVRDGQQAKLTQAALETLAVVAYRQPVSRSKVSAIRGVNCDGVMRTLLARGLVEEYGNDHETGAVLYQTTGYFLERMGLKSLEELPELAPLLPSAADVDVEDFA